MKPRKYQDISVSNEVYVSSSYDHFFSVYMRCPGGKPIHINEVYSWRGELDHVYPKYVMEAVERAILELLKSGKAVFHEYDRDGNKRYENLRYHEPEQVEWMIERLEAEYGEVLQAET